MWSASGEFVSESEFLLSKDEAEVIVRLSSLEYLRDQARAGQRSAILANIERLIETELRTLKRLRSQSANGEPSTGA